MKMNLSSPEGRVITIRSNQKDARKCYESSLKNRRSYNIVAISQEGKVAEVLETKLSHRPRPGPAGDVQEREIEGKLFKLGALLGQELQDQIVRVIARHLHAFAWTSADMSGYQAIEKAALAVVFAARWLRHYFHGFGVIVMTDLPIHKVLQKPDIAGRMVRWLAELSEFDIHYE